MKSLHISSEAALNNAAGSISLAVQSMVQDVGAFIHFGCAFVANVSEIFTQRGQATQSILSVGTCNSLLVANNYFANDALGYYVRAPNLTVSGECMFVSMVLRMCFCDL